MIDFKQFLILVESSEASNSVLMDRVRCCVEELEKIKEKINSIKVRQLRRDVLELRTRLTHVKTVDQRNKLIKSLLYVEKHIERLKKRYLSVH